MADVSTDVLAELDKIQNYFRGQTNNNIVGRHGITELLTDFQKPITDEIKSVGKNITDSTNKNIVIAKTQNDMLGKKIDNLRDLKVAFEAQLATEWDKNLTESTRPRVRFNNDGTYDLVMNGKALKFHYDKEGINIVLPDSEKILLTGNLTNLLKGADYGNVDDVNDLLKYEKLLKSSGITNRSPRFKQMKQRIMNLSTQGFNEDTDFERDAEHSLQFQDSSSELFPATSIHSLYGEGLKSQSVTKAIAVDLTNKSPIDLFIELNKLKIAKNAGNNNTLARANIILDRLKKLKAITEQQYLKKLKFFT